MSGQYFTEEEALAKVGTIIESLVPFSGVPKGTTGTVIRADPSRSGKSWTEAIQWILPRNQAGFITRQTGKPLVDWFSKDEYERHLKETGV